jgi:hypothetical protein
MTPFLAMITPLSSSGPGGPSAPIDPGYGIPDTGWNRPTHPIAPGGGWTPGTPPPRPQPQPPGGPVDPGWSGGTVPVDPGFNPPGVGAPGSKPPMIPGGPIYIWGGGPGVRPPLPLPPEAVMPPGEGGGPIKVEWKAA